MTYTDLTDEDVAEINRRTMDIKKELFRIRDRELNVSRVYRGRPCDMAKVRKALDLMRTHLDRLEKQAAAFSEAFGMDIEAYNRFEEEIRHAQPRN